MTAANARRLRNYLLAMVFNLCLTVRIPALAWAVGVNSEMPCLSVGCPAERRCLGGRGQNKDRESWPIVSLRIVKDLLVAIS